MRPATLLRAVGPACLLAAFAAWAGTLESVTRPAMTGPWVLSKAATALKTRAGKPPPLTPLGLKLYEANKAAPDTDPMRGCLPPGIPRTYLQAAFPFSVIRGERYTAIMYEWNHLPRIIYMDAGHFENIGPTYLGQSIGKWEGDTLVVHTNGFNGRTWLDDSGLPHTEELEVSERIRLRGTNTLESIITISDPKIYSAAWSTVLTFTRKPDAIVKEDYCFGRTGQGVTVSR